MLRKTIKLLVIESALFSILAVALFTLMFSRSYTFHFGQVSLNTYADGTSDFTTDASSLVRSLGTVAIFSLFFGVTTGVAIGLTCSQRVKKPNSSSAQSEYEEEMTKMGFVVINKTKDGTTYKLTELGRRFLRDYRFLEKTEEPVV